VASVIRRLYDTNKVVRNRRSLSERNDDVQQYPSDRRRWCYPRGNGSTVPPPMTRSKFNKQPPRSDLGPGTQRRDYLLEPSEYYDRVETDPVPCMTHKHRSTRWGLLVLTQDNQPSYPTNSLIPTQPFNTRQKNNNEPPTHLSNPTLYLSDTHLCTFPTTLRISNIINTGTSAAITGSAIFQNLRKKTKRNVS
jgi:hypothetical protein